VAQVWPTPPNDPPADRLRKATAATRRAGAIGREVGRLGLKNCEKR